MPESTSQGWYGLMSILQSARDEAKQPHREDDECPNDGTLLLQGPHGERFCPFDGHRR